MKVALTVDVESDCGLERQFKGVENIDRLINFFNEKKIKATFFITGTVIRKYPEIIDKLKGHEIASHSYEHLELTKTDYEKQIKKAKDILEENGIKNAGFRAPRLKVNSEIITRILEYFAYDSSIISNKSIRDNAIKEIPVSHIYKIPFGLTYFIINKRIMTMLLKKMKPPEKVVLYCHSTDFVKINEKPKILKTALYYSKCKPENIEILKEIINYFKINNAEFSMCKELIEKTDL